MSSATPPDFPENAANPENAEKAASTDSPATPERAANAEASVAPSSLTHRWWWQGAVLVIVGIAVVAFQWEVIPSGEANLANWLVALLGAGAIGYGIVEVVQANRRRRADLGPQDPEP